MLRRCGVAIALACLLNPLAHAGAIVAPPLPALDPGFWCGQTVLCGAAGRSVVDSVRLPDSTDRLGGLHPKADGSVFVVGSSRASANDIRIFALTVGANGQSQSGAIVVPTAISGIDDTVLDTDGLHVLVLASVSATQKKVVRLGLDGTIDGSFGSQGVLTYTQVSSYLNLGRGQILRRAGDGHLLLLLGSWATDLSGNALTSVDYATSQSTPSVDKRVFLTPGGGGGNVDVNAAVFGPAGDAVAIASHLTNTLALTLYQPATGPSHVEHLSLTFPGSASCSAISGGLPYVFDAAALGDGRVLVEPRAVGADDQHPMAVTASLAAADFGPREAACENAANAGYLSAVTLSHPYGANGAAVPLAVQFDAQNDGSSVKRLRYVVLVGDTPLLEPMGNGVTWPNASSGDVGAPATVLSGADTLVEAPGMRYFLGTTRRWSGSNEDYALARFVADTIFADGFEPDGR